MKGFPATGKRGFGMREVKGRIRVSRVLDGDLIRQNLGHLIVVALLPTIVGIGESRRR